MFGVGKMWRTNFGQKENVCGKFGNAFVLTCIVMHFYPNKLSSYWIYEDRYQCHNWL